MKRILSWRHHYVARVSTFLITLAFIAGMIGCGGGGDGDNGEYYDLTIASTAGGNVTIPGEGTHTYNEGTVVDIVAVVDECYEFVNWTGGVGTIANVTGASTNITMNGNYDITANFRPLTCESLDYFPTTEGYGIKYHVTDNYADGLECDVWAVSQNYTTGLPDDLDFVFTLIGEGMTGRYYCPCSLGGQTCRCWGGKEFTAFYVGSPAGNQGNFYMNFNLPCTFTSGDQWTLGSGATAKKYTVVDLGYQTIPGIGSVECVKVTIDDYGNTNPYLQGSGYFVLAKGVGIVELVFNRTDPDYISVVSYEYEGRQQWVKHKIWGTVFDDYGNTLGGIVIAISHANWGTYYMTGSSGFFEIQAYGPDVVLRAWYDQDNNNVCDDFNVNDLNDPNYPKQYCVNDVNSDIPDLSIDISEMWLWGICFPR